MKKIIFTILGIVFITSCNSGSKIPYTGVYVNNILEVAAISQKENTYLMSFGTCEEDRIIKDRRVIIEKDVLFDADTKEEIASFNENHTVLKSSKRPILFYKLRNSAENINLITEQANQLSREIKYRSYIYFNGTMLVFITDANGKKFKKLYLDENGTITNEKYSDIVFSENGFYDSDNEIKHPITEYFSIISFDTVHQKSLKTGSQFILNRYEPDIFTYRTKDGDMDSFTKKLQNSQILETAIGTFLYFAKEPSTDRLNKLPHLSESGGGHTYYRVSEQDEHSREKVIIDFDIARYKESIHISGQCVYKNFRLSIQGL